MEFGYTIKGSTGDSSWQFIGGKFTAPEDGTVISISAAIWNWSSLIIDVNFGLYEDNNGSVGTFVASGIKISVDPLFNGWKTISVSADIKKGIVYWIVAQKNDPTSILFWGDGLGSSTEYYDTSHTFDTWGTPIGGTYILNYNLSIYATYITSAPTSPNFTSRKNLSGYLAFVQQYIKHKINGTTPWANPDGDLL